MTIEENINFGEKIRKKIIKEGYNKMTSNPFWKEFDDKIRRNRKENSCISEYGIGFKASFDLKRNDKICYACSNEEEDVFIYTEFIEKEGRYQCPICGVTYFPNEYYRKPVRKPKKMKGKERRKFRRFLKSIGIKYTRKQFKRIKIYGK